jgi:hypothetical protein
MQRHPVKGLRQKSGRSEALKDMGTLTRGNREPDPFHFKGLQRPVGEFPGVERPAGNPCVSASRLDPTHKPPQNIELSHRFASWGGPFGADRDPHSLSIG